MKTATGHENIQRYATFSGITIREIYCPNYGHTVDLIDTNICHCGTKIN
jgi:hypothetical protein